MRRAIRQRGGARAGFTLVELLMGIVLSSIFAVGLYGFFFSQSSAARNQQTQAIAQADARTALDRLARDVRQAISPDDGLTPPVISVSPTSIEMYVDSRRDGTQTSPVPQKVRYSVVTGELRRETSNPTGPVWPYTYGPYGRPEELATGVQNGAAPVFTTLTREGAALPASVAGPQARDVALVTVRLLLAQKTGQANSQLELTTDVALRNAIRI